MKALITVLMSLTLAMGCSKQQGSSIEIETPPVIVEDDDSTVVEPTATPTPEPTTTTTTTTTTPDPTSTATNTSTGAVSITSQPSANFTQGSYSYTAVYSGTSGANYVCTMEVVDGSTLAPGLVFDPNTCSVSSNVVMGPGTYKYRIIVTNSADANEYAIQELWITIPQGPSVAITSNPPASYSANPPYQYTATYSSTNSSATYVCSIEPIAGLIAPPGISVGEDSCLVSIADRFLAGQYGYALNVTNTADASDVSIQEHRITVQGASSSSSVTINQPVQGQGNFAYSVQYAGLSGENYVCSIGQVPGYTLPPGLAIVSSTSTSCSVASSSSFGPGEYRFRFVVTNTADSSDTAYQEMFFNVAPRVSITSQPPSQYPSDGNYQYPVQFNPADANSTYQCTIQTLSGRNLPPSISVGASTCIVSITAVLTSGGNYGYTVRVSNVNDANDYSEQYNTFN